MKKMYFRKFCAALTISSLLLTGLSACTPKQEENSQDVKTQKAEGSSDEMITIRVGTQPTTMGTPLEYAMNQSWFEEAGIKIERILFPTGAPINEAVAAKELDIAINGLATVYAVAAGDVTWIGEINNAGGLGVYVRADNPVLTKKGQLENLPNVYGDKESLTGMKVLGPLGTSSQFNVITWMEKFGLKSTDYQMLSMDHGPAAQAFIAGEGDAVASSPPYTYQLEEAGMVKVCSLEDVSGIVLMDGICVLNDYYKENREAVKKFMEVIYKAQEALGNDDKLVYDVCMKYYNDNGRVTTDKDMNMEIKDRDFVDKDIMTAPEYRFGSVLFGMGQFYVDDGKILAEDFENIKTGVDPSLLEEIYNIDIKVYGED